MRTIMRGAGPTALLIAAIVWVERMTANAPRERGG
jgi:hypothetical protein